MGRAAPAGTGAELRLCWVMFVPGWSRHCWWGRMSPGMGVCEGGMGRGGEAPAGIVAVTVLPVPRGERWMDGDTQGPVSHSRAHTRTGNLHLLGSDPMRASQLVPAHAIDSTANATGRAPSSIARHSGCTTRPPKNPFPGVLTPLSPPHPRYAASQAPCCRGAALNSSQDSSFPQRGASQLWEPPARVAGPSGGRRYGC